MHQSVTYVVGLCVTQVPGMGTDLPHVRLQLHSAVHTGENKDRRSITVGCATALKPNNPKLLDKMLLAASVTYGATL
jgi:hypothetical protein